MHITRVAVVALAAATAAVLVALPADAGESRSASIVNVRVLAGKPSEFKFKLSKASVPKGSTVIFTVVDKGALAHDFKINGRKTKVLSPGSGNTLKVRFTKTGRYPYICTVTGHAAAGMKGMLRVVAARAT